MRFMVVPLSGYLCPAPVAPDGWIMRGVTLARKWRTTRSKVRRVLQPTSSWPASRYSDGIPLETMPKGGLSAHAKASPAKLRDMKRFVRCFVMWLLVFALPVQGFAASTMLLCGAGHHGASQATDGGHDHASHMHMGVQDAPVASAPHADHDHATQVTPADKGLSFSPVAAKHAKVVGKCSACAACCTVAFLPTNVIAFTAPASSRVLPVVELTTHAGFIADGLERPPRLPLA